MIAPISRARTLAIACMATLVLGACQCAAPPLDHDAGAALDARARDLGLADRAVADRPAADGAALADAADAGDAGFVCQIPHIELPPDIDASPSACPGELVDLSGSFQGTWSGLVFGDSFLTGEFSYTSYGELAFEVFCLGNKLWVRGEMVGLAEGVYPFWGELLGELDADSGVAAMVMEQGYLCLAALSEDAGAPEDGAFADAAAPAFSCAGLAVTFTVLLEGVQQQGRFDDGSWCGRSLFPPGAMGSGAWQATRE